MTQLGLTAQQHALKQFIAEHVASNAIPPSFDEMRIALGLKSKSGIHRLLTSLEARGHIERRAGRSRAIRLVEDPGIATADALRVVISRCTLSRATSVEMARLLADATGGQGA